MTCTEFLKILDDVIDESIAVETRSEIEAHLRKCGHCEVVLNTTRKTIQIFRFPEIYEVSTEVSERLHAKIMEKCKKAR